jgi:hypothetical protein
MISEFYNLSETLAEFVILDFVHSTTKKNSDSSLIFFLKGGVLYDATDTLTLICALDMKNKQIKIKI